MLFCLYSNRAAKIRKFGRTAKRFARKVMYWSKQVSLIRWGVPTVGPYHPTAAALQVDRLLPALAARGDAIHKIPRTDRFCTEWRWTTLRTHKIFNTEISRAISPIPPHHDVTVSIMCNIVIFFVSIAFELFVYFPLPPSEASYQCTFLDIG